MFGLVVVKGGQFYAKGGRTPSPLDPKLYLRVALAAARPGGIRRGRVATELFESLLDVYCLLQ